MLELKGVNTFYGNIPALRDVNITVSEGEIVTLIGANGAGKTTTLMTICGGIQPRSGEILYDGVPIHRMKPNKIVRLGISQVPEGRLIFSVPVGSDGNFYWIPSARAVCTASSYSTNSFRT